MPKLASLTVSQIGLGGMSLSGLYGQSDDTESLAVIHRAIDLGITFLDTATGYGKGHNETLFGQAVADRRDQLVLASKFTHGQHGQGPSAPPVTAREAVEASLRRLNVDYIDLYYLHRVDPVVPIEESVGQLGRLQDEGKIRGVGVSEASAAQIRRAHAAYPLTALQSEYSLWAREIEPEILPAIRELGIGFVGFSPLGRGFLAGAQVVDANDRRNSLPRWKPDAIAANTLRRDTIERVAARLGASAAQVSLAWVLSKGVVPLFGTRRTTHLESNAAAAKLQLSAEDVRELEAAFVPGEIAGDRFPEEEARNIPPSPWGKAPAAAVQGA
jgi:aryl-alcohol dehydrogenase-like predicted oxidoreductase